MILPNTADIVIIGGGVMGASTLLILDGNFKTLDISMLDLARFKEGRLIQEYNVV